MTVNALFGLFFVFAFQHALPILQRSAALCKDLHYSGLFTVKPRSKWLHNMVTDLIVSVMKVGSQKYLKWRAHLTIEGL